MGRNVDGNPFEVNGLSYSHKAAPYEVGSTPCDQAPAAQERPIARNSHYNRADTRTFGPIAADWDLEEFSAYCSRTPS